MKTDIRLTQMIAIAGALACAQCLHAGLVAPPAAGGAVGAAGNAGGAIHGPAFGGFQSGSAAGAVVAPGSAGAGSAVSGAASATGAPGVSAGGSASGVETIGMRQARFGTQTADNASVHGGNAGASGSLSASLNTGPAIDEIQETKFAARDKLKVDVDSSIGTGEQAMGRMETGIKAAKKASLADFELAQNAVFAREKELKASVAATADATMDTWGGPARGSPSPSAPTRPPSPRPS